MDYTDKLFISVMLLLAFCFLGKPVLGDTNDAHAAAALFQNFETVFRTTPSLTSNSAADVRSGLPRQPFGFLLTGLDRIGPTVRTNVLESSEAVLVGTKDYHAPIGLGPVRSTRCYVLVLRKESRFQLAPYFSKVETGLAAGGGQIWNWTAEVGEFGEGDPRPSAFFATQFVQSYILVSNDLDELIKVSGQLALAKDDSGVFAGIREWNDVSQHEFWGYRRYKHVGMQGTTRRIAGTDRITADAEALIVYIDPKKQTGVLRVLSSNAKDSTVKNIDATNWMPPFRSVGPGAWETVFPLAEDGPFAGSANSVLWLFGCGVIV